MEKCIKCGSTEIDKGKTVCNTWFPRYISQKQKFGFGTFGQLEEIEAYLCLQCGYMEFYTNPEKYKNL